MAEVLHATATYSGQVQGVGFRYAVLQAAKEFEVAGWVANLADGRVLIETEGRESEVEAFLAAVLERMHGHVRKVERGGSRREARFTGFTIK